MTKVVAAVDVGTHGVAFAWARVGDREPEIHCFDGWPDQIERDPKNLTALLVAADGAVVAWGHRAKQRELAARHPELAYYAHFRMGTAGASAAVRFDAVELTSMLLTELYPFALREITTSTGAAATEVAWRLTIPATWPDRERQLLRMAAERAGFPADDRLTLVIEPEAALLHCVTVPDLLPPDARVVVVDAGAGIVDVASYAISGGTGLAELGRATGGPLGADVLDARFFDHVTAQLGEEITDDSLRLALLDVWEYAKRDYYPDRESPLSIIIPARVRATLRGTRGDVLLWPAQARALFDHVVEPIVEGIREHVAAAGPGAPCHILLTGGLARSAYLTTRVREAFPGNPVVVPPRPAHAAVLGAVRSGLRQDAVVSRVSRFTYGINANMPFERRNDSRRRRFKDGYGTVRCRDRFAIFVRSGQSVPVGTALMQEFQPRDPWTTLVSLPVYASEQRNPRYTDVEGSTKIGELTVDVSATVKLPADRRNIVVTLTFGNTEITVHARDTHSGTELVTTLDFVTTSQPP